MQLFWNRSPSGINTGCTTTWPLTMMRKPQFLVTRRRSAMHAKYGAAVTHELVLASFASNCCGCNAACGHEVVERSPTSRCRAFEIRRCHRLATRDTRQGAIIIIDVLYDMTCAYQIE